MGWENIIPNPLFGYLTTSNLEESVGTSTTVESFATIADESVLTSVESVS